MKRGIGNQSLRKVNGHATEKDIENGISNIEDGEGNDTSDKLADKGVEAIAGIGLVKLGKWLEARQKTYRRLIVRVHKMIVAVTLAEKEERRRDHTIQKALLGFEPPKSIKADAEVRDEGHLEVEHQELETIAPSRGLHSFAHCQVLYEEVHDFIKKRKWALAQIDTEVAREQE